MINDPKIWMIAFVGGILPSILWLWFWLKEDRRNPEPKTLLTIIFIMGMLTVLLVLPIQKIIQSFSLPHGWELIAWAGTEEIVKLLMIILIISGTSQTDEPTDWPI